MSLPSHSLTLRQEGPNYAPRVFLVGEWPDDIVATAELLEHVLYARREPKDRVRFTFENGDALYAIIGPAGSGYLNGNLHLRKISCSRSLP